MNSLVKNLLTALVMAGVFAASADGTDGQETDNPAEKYNNDPSLIAALCQDFVDDVGEKAVSDFGLGILEGADGLFGYASDDYSEEPPPNPMYPGPMEKGALYFGGTDLGRFIPETLILNDGVRSDISLITQNALADGRYLSSARERLCGKASLPTEQELEAAFSEFVEGVQDGRIDAGDALTFKDDRVTVSGALAVMKINEIISKKIFEMNKGKRAMYVEESYPMEWMFDYMTPHGLVMKLNAEPSTAVSDKEVRENAEFWDWMTKRLLSSSAFSSRRAEHWHKGADGKCDPDHRIGVRGFTKLRLAHARLYAYRSRNPGAFETAVRQAVAIDPQDPETNHFYTWFLKVSGLNDARDDYLGYIEKLGVCTDRYR